MGLLGPMLGFTKATCPLKKRKEKKIRDPNWTIIFAFSQFVYFPIFSLASSLQIRASDPTCLAASPAWKV
jgi:hypothetical protein